MELDELHEGVGSSLSKDRNLGGTRRQFGELATRQTRETAEQQRRATALRAGGLAAAGHHAAGDLEEEFPQAARYIRDAAAGFEHISNLLRDPAVDDVATLIGNLGRKQPATIVAAAVLIGLGLSWFLRSPDDGAGRTPPDIGDGEGGVYGIQ